MYAGASSHSYATRGNRFVSYVALAAVVGGLTGMGAIASAEPAEAVTAGVLQPGVAVSGVTGVGDVWLGAMQAPVGYGDDVVFCSKAGGTDPVGKVATRQDIISDPALAMVMGKHRWDNDATTRAAISYLTHMRWEEGSNGVSAAARKARFEVRTPQSVKDRAQWLLQEAAPAAGPFSAPGATPAGSGARTGDIHNVGVQTATGGWTPGLRFTASLTGPAVFDATGTPRFDGITDATPLALHWTATGTGPVTFDVTYRDVPRVTLTRVFGPGNVQTVITYGHRAAGFDPAEISPPPVSFDVTADFQPVARTAVGSRTVAVGDELVDRVTVGTAQGDTWLAVGGVPVPVTFVGTAYATGALPPAEQSSVPADAVALGETRLTVNAPGTYPASIPGTGGAQFVTWVWRMSVAEQPTQWQAYLRGDWQDAFGLPAETASVRHRATATSQVAVLDDGAGRPEGLADDVVVTGFPDDHPGFSGAAGFTADRPTLTQSLWFFPPDVPVTDERRGEATLLGQVELPAANGTYRSVGAGLFTLPRTATGAGVPGTYVFTHGFAGDDRVEPFETSVTQATEQFVLQPRLLSVTTTAIADRAVVLGDHVAAHDVATVTGDIPVGATVAFELYQWPTGGPPLCTAPVWTSPELTLTGEGDVTSPPADVVTLEGDLGFVAVVRDGGGAVLARGECGAAEETLIAGRHQVVTTAHSDRAAVFGDRVSVWDVATVTGRVPTDATLTFELYTWPTGTLPRCDLPIWVSEPVPLALGDTRSADIPIDPVTGDLGFVEVIRGSDGRVLSRGVCGAVSETIIDDALAVTTLAASSSPPQRGRSVEVWDVATVRGTAAAATTLTFELYTWPDGTEPVCIAPLWTSIPVPLTAPGDVTSARTTVDRVTGALGFVTVMRGADGRVLARSECGEPAETLTPVRGLAETGLDLRWPAAVAGALVVLGALAVVAARRRVG